jgi:hypothetical protein
MSPETIPWIFCGSLCLLPISLVVVTWSLLGLIANRHYSLERYTHIDEAGIKHTSLELTRLTREEIKIRNQEDKKNA